MNFLLKSLNLWLYNTTQKQIIKNVMSDELKLWTIPWTPWILLLNKNLFSLLKKIFKKWIVKLKLNIIVHSQKILMKKETKIDLWTWKKAKYSRRKVSKWMQRKGSPMRFDRLSHVKHYVTESCIESGRDKNHLWRPLKRSFHLIT